MEARMIEALLSEKAEERRALFEEAAGIGLYRDRKTSTERRLEETAADLARLEDLVSEVQTQVRSLARQRGKAERHGKMIEERFGIALTLVRRELEDFDLTLGGLGQRAEQLAAALPEERARLEAAEREREAAVLARHTAELGQQLADASQERARRAETEWAATAQVGTRAQEAAALARAAAEAAAALEQARRRVAGLKEQETHERTARRQAEAALAQVTARRDALAELERERVGLAPAAQALLKARARFGDAVIGPLSDFLRTSRRDAVLAEQLLGEWLHAVLVRDANAIETIRRWHEEVQPGPLVLLPSVPGPRLAADGNPLNDDLRVDGPAAAWVRALLAGNEVLDGGEAAGAGAARRPRGRALRRANGAVFLAGTTAGGPLERRAELEGLAQEVREADVHRGDAATTL